MIAPSRTVAIAAREPRSTRPPRDLTKRASNPAAPGRESNHALAVRPASETLSLTLWGTTRQVRAVSRLARHFSISAQARRSYGVMSAVIATLSVRTLKFEVGALGM